MTPTLVRREKWREKRERYRRPGRMVNTATCIKISYDKCLII